MLNASNVETTRSAMVNDELVEAQEKKGKLSAKDRILSILDENSFIEIYSLLSKDNNGAGLISGYGTINCRPVHIISQDYTVNKGAINITHAEKICKTLKHALSSSTPVILLLDSAGISLETNIDSMQAFSKIIKCLNRLKGIVPIISLVYGECYGVNSVLANLADIKVACEKITVMSLNTTNVINANFASKDSVESISSMQSLEASGMFELVVENEREGFSLVKKLIHLLPDCAEDLPNLDDINDLNRLSNISESLSATEIINELSDELTNVILFPKFEDTIVTCLCKIGGHSVLLAITNVEGGEINLKALNKLSNVINFADTFNIPVVTLVNSSGIKLVPQNKQSKLIKAISNTIKSYNNANVAKISVVLGKAYGHIYTTLVSKSQNDMVFALPGATLSTLEPEAAVRLLKADEIKNSTLSPDETINNMIEKYIENEASSIVMAKKGIVDEIIEPSHLRMHIIASLEMLRYKSSCNFSKKHDNLTL